MSHGMQSDHSADDSKQPVVVRGVDRLAAYAVHVLTASGAAIAALTAAAIFSESYSTAFLLMATAVVVDAVDGPLARRIRIRHVCPEIDGRKLDDIVDYLNYTFLPILLLAHAGWLPDPVWGWAAIPLVTSLFGFANVGAKEEQAGFFRGFPSYWNIVVFYVAVWLHGYGRWTVLALVLALSLLTVLPVRFVYPNRPPRWMPLFVGGGVIWLGVLLGLLMQYPDTSAGLVALSLVYPAVYVVLSIYLDVKTRNNRAA